MESGHFSGVPTLIYESDKLQAGDCDRVRRTLAKISDESRIQAEGEWFEKIAN